VICTGWAGAMRVSVHSGSTALMPTRGTAVRI